MAEGAHVTFTGMPKTWVPDFVHGADGFGNVQYPPVQVLCDQILGMLRQATHSAVITRTCVQGAAKHDLDAADFIADAVSRHPGEVSILALGPLTNLALAMQRHPAVATQVVSMVSATSLPVMAATGERMHEYLPVQHRARLLCWGAPSSSMATSTLQQRPTCLAVRGRAFVTVKGKC